MTPIELVNNKAPEVTFFQASEISVGKLTPRFTSDSTNTAPTDKDIVILIDVDEEHPELNQELDYTSDLGDRASDPEVTPSTTPLLDEPGSSGFCGVGRIKAFRALFK